MGRTGVLLIVGTFASLAWIGFAAIQPANALSLSALGAIVAFGMAFSPRARAAADRFLSSPRVQVGPGFIVTGLLVWCTGAAIAAQALSAPPTQVEVQPSRADGTAVSPAHRPDTAPETVRDAGSALGADAGNLGAEALRVALAATPATPSAEAIALDREYRNELRTRPGVNAYDVVARRHRLTIERATELIANVAEYRQSLADAARGDVGRGVIGRVAADVAVPTDIGDTTLMISLTVYGCPASVPRDPRLDALATAALRRIAANVPAGIDSYRATIGYEGVLCAPGRFAYGATWTRADNTVSIR